MATTVLSVATVAFSTSPMEMVDTQVLLEAIRLVTI
jgi:hypothetical protein